MASGEPVRVEQAIHAIGSQRRQELALWIGPKVFLR
jgi:hypothetical protein